MSSYVLIVDDDRDGSAALQRLLERDGMQVACATSAREAMVSILSRRPDLLIMDLFMPGMDGQELLEVVRAYERLHNQPGIVLTGHSDSLLVSRAAELGVNGVLIKGNMTFDQLRGAVHRALARPDAGELSEPRDEAPSYLHGG
jgi:CheY-like chemotaxis protein